MSKIKFYQQSATQIANHFQVSPEKGLVNSQVEKNLKEYGLNQLDEPKKPSRILQFLRQFQDPMVYLLLFALAVSLVIIIFENSGEFPFDAVVIGAILILNSTIGFVQEIKAEQAMEALKNLTSPKTLVLRNGYGQEINIKEVVPGDILLLAEGDIVPADARIIEANHLQVAEASLTGESVPVVKNNLNLTQDLALGDRKNMLFASTEIISGSGKAIVVATGMKTQVGKIAQMVMETKETPSPLTLEINQLAKTLTKIVIVITILTILLIVIMSGLHSFENFIDIFLIAISLAVAAVPEGLLAILSVVMSIGMLAMSKKNAIVKQLPAVETLGSVNIICSDKTGTLTKNEMKVEESLDALGDALGDKLSDFSLKLSLQIGILANDSIVHPQEKTILGDPTETSLIDYSLAYSNPDYDPKNIQEKDFAFYQSTISQYEIIQKIPFNSVRKKMSVITKPRNSKDELFLASKGAPDVLLQNSNFYLDGTSIKPLTDQIRQNIINNIQDLSSQAYRTLGFAYKIIPNSEFEKIDSNDNEELEKLEDNLIYVSTYGIIDPARPEAKDAIQEAKKGGVRTIMITGDHPLTAGKIAQNLEIIDLDAKLNENLDQYVLTGMELDQLSDDELLEKLTKVSVFARVAPKHKYRIVELLQSIGNIVAMTGDGVNDAPAVKKADIGISMGITGTEVTKSVAKVILADDNFVTIVSAIKQGRIIFNNLKKSLKFLLATNTAEVLTIFFGVMLAPLIGLSQELLASGSMIISLLTATQILFLNFVSDSAPALALGMDKAQDDVMAQKPKPKSQKIIDRNFWITNILFGILVAFFCLLSVDMSLPGGLIGNDVWVWMNQDLQISNTAIYVVRAKSMAFTLLVVSIMVYAFSVRSNEKSMFYKFFDNKFLLFSVLISIALQILIVQVPLLNPVFQTFPLSANQYLVIGIFTFIIIAITESRKFFFKKFPPKSK